MARNPLFMLPYFKVKMPKKRIILYGKSIILGTLAVSLQGRLDIEVVSLSRPLPQLNQLGDLAPDVIVYDMEGAYPDDALSLIKVLPELLLIGINPETDQMLFWFGKKLHVHEVQELMQIINSFSVSPETSHPPILGNNI